MEPSTGTVIYEKNGEEQRSPASITKIMTLLLIFEALEDGQITLEEEAVTSAYAKRMGGSQDRKSTRLNSSHSGESRMPSSA